MIGFHYSTHIFGHIIKVDLCNFRLSTVVIRLFLWGRKTGSRSSDPWINYKRLLWAAMRTKQNLVLCARRTKILQTLLILFFWFVLKNMLKESLLYEKARVVVLDSSGQWWSIMPALGTFLPLFLKSNIAKKDDMCWGKAFLCEKAREVVWDSAASNDILFLHWDLFFGHLFWAFFTKTTQNIVKQVLHEKAGEVFLGNIHKNCP